MCKSLSWRVGGIAMQCQLQSSLVAGRFNKEKWSVKLQEILTRQSLLNPTTSLH
jgi:hypothetical protein